MSRYAPTHRFSRRIVTCCILGCLLVSSTQADATGQGQWALGIAPTYAYLVQDGQSEPRGGGGALYMHYSLSEAIALRWSGLWTVHTIDSSTDENGSGQASSLFHVGNLALGLRYAFDLLSVCPAIEGGVGLLYQKFQQETAIDIGLQFGVSVDYLLSPWLSVGAAFHYHAFISNPTEYPVYFDTGPRIAVVWQ